MKTKCEISEIGRDANNRIYVRLMRDDGEIDIVGLHDGEIAKMAAAMFDEVELEIRLPRDDR